MSEDGPTHDIYNKINKKYIIKKIVNLITTTSNYNKNTNNPIEKTIYANYAAGYLWALKDIFTDIDIKEAGYEIFKIRDDVIYQQDNSTRSMIDVCKNFGPNK